MENFRAHLIMVACGVASEAKSTPATRFSKFVKTLLPHPLAYGSTDVDLITGTENFPAVTQSETYTSANPDNPNEIVVAYNDSSGAPNNYSGASVSTDGGLTFTRLTPNPFAAAGTNFGDPIALYNKSSATWHTIWIDTACGGFGLGGYSSTDPRTRLAGRRISACTAAITMIGNLHGWRITHLLPSTGGCMFHGTTST